MPDLLVGRFALQEAISTGGSGSVWLAWDVRRGDWCAAKVLRQRDSADLLRFVREQGVKFDHPHVLSPYSWGAEDDYVVIASPLVRGGTLDQVLADNGPASEPVAAAILDQLLSGLSHVHEAGWTHRDVKPSNILFERSGESWPHLRLADFGIAIHVDDARLTHAGNVIGTEGFLAPEAARGAPPGPRQDLFAAGIVALVALGASQDVATDPGERAAALGMVQDGRLRAVIETLTHVDPLRRPKSAADARAILGFARPAGGPLAATGEPFETFDRIEPSEQIEPSGHEPTTTAAGPATQQSSRQLPWSLHSGVIIAICCLVAAAMIAVAMYALQ